MSSNFTQSPYLRTSRSFPEDLHQISIEMNKAYIDIANVVNARTIGIFTTSVASISGEAWFIRMNEKQQGFRKVYPVSSLANIPHGLNFSNVQAFTRCYGEYTDSSGNWYGFISASNVSIIGQISFYLTPTNIVFLSGAGAPTLTNGNIVLEWISNV
jgi:hypothetical protein